MSLPRAYLRIDPNMDAHPDPEAMLTLILFGNRCSERGRFRSLTALEKLLGKKRLKACLDRKDLVPISGGRYYVSGWDEWQEGDLTVGERMSRVRKRRSMEPQELQADDRNDSVTEPSPDRITGRNSPSEALTLTLDVDVQTDRPRAERVVVSPSEPKGPSPVPTTAPPVGSSDGKLTPERLGILYPDTPQHRKLVEAFVALVELQVQDAPGSDPKAVALDTLAAISTTRNGKAVDSLDLRGISQPWAAVTWKAAHRFAEDNGYELPP